MSPRTGRPHSENPKNVEVKARIDENTARRLFAYCERLGITRTEALREGIERILKDAEKKKQSVTHPEKVINALLIPPTSGG